MYLLYIDDSGQLTDKHCKHCVLAGFAIREAKTYWAQQAIDNMIEQYLGTYDIELHGTYTRTGKKEWRRFPKQLRDDLIKAVLQYIASNYPGQFILFGAVLNKSTYQGTSLYEELFTQITSRFDMFLKRRYDKTRKREKGIAIFDKTILEHQFQTWSHTFQKTGNHWGNTLINFAEVPLFLDSKMSRLIQIADIIAYSIYRKFEHNDDNYFSLIQNCFDRDTASGAVHGLYAR